jgi:general secretion pathway protein G
VHLVPATAVSAHHTVGYIQSLRRRSGGFTLVELLVVIAIIGVLATLVLLQLGTARGRARDTKRITDVNQFRTAIEQYYEDHDGSYPTDIYSDDMKVYLTKLPMDPLIATEEYGYGYNTVNGKVTSYQVYAKLEQNAAALSAAAAIDGSKLSTKGIDASGAAAACKKGPPSRDICIYDQGVIQ